MKTKCVMCGEGEMTSHRENYKYDGLPGVTLQDVEVLQCGNCGAREIVIPRLADMVRTLAMLLVQRKARPSGAEIRFLRKSLGWSGVDFAKHLGVGADTVSKWENDKEPIGPQSDRLLRLMVVHGTPIEDYSLDSLVDLEDKSTALRIKLAPNKNGWQVAAA